MATPMKAQPARRSDAPTERKDVVRNRQKIVDAARELFSDQHPLQVQLDDVAELAGVSRATSFRHIGSRHELIAMVYRDRLADIMGLTDAAAAMDDPWQSLELCIRTLVDWLHTDVGWWTS